MPSRSKRANSWQEPRKGVARAKAYIERFEVQTAHPDDYLDPLPQDEALAWNDLLSKMP